MNLFFRYLLRGSDDLTLPKSWLADTHRLRLYESWTKRQLDQGTVVSDVAAMRRAAFWRAIEAQRQASETVGDRLLRFAKRNVS